MFSNAIFLRIFLWITFASTTLSIPSTFHGTFTNKRGLVIGPTVALYNNTYLSNTIPFNHIIDSNSMPQINNAPRVDIMIELTQSGVGPSKGYVGMAIHKINDRFDLVQICGLPVEEAKNLQVGDVNYDIFEIDLTNNGQKQRVSHQYITLDTAVYGVIMQFCPTHIESDSTVEVLATIQPIHENGYLSAHGLLSLKFNKWAVFLCAFLTLAWLHFMIKWYNELLPHHWLILFTISFAAVSSTIKYLHMTDMNLHAQPNQYLWLISAIANVICNEYTRIIVMFSSLGWGISRPNLKSKHVIGITVITILHMTIASINAYLDIESILFSDVSMWNAAARVGLAILDATTFWYVFDSLSDEMQKMRAGKQRLKLSLYQNFSAVLIINCILCFLTAIAEVNCVSSNYFLSASHWPLLWMFIEGIWKGLFLLTLGSIMILWRPHENSQKYAYFKELNGCISDIENDLDKSVFHLPLDGQIMKLPTPKFTIGDIDLSGIDVTSDDGLFGI